MLPAINFHLIGKMSIMQLKTSIANRRCPSTIGSNRVSGGDSDDIMSLSSRARSLYRQLLALPSLLAPDTAK